MAIDTPPVGIGLVGAGAFGEFCLNAFASMREVRTVAVADIDPDRANRLANRYGAAAYPSLETLLANSAVEIVALNTPPHLHGAGGLTVLRAGKHLFCEKPLALDLEIGEQLLKERDARYLRLTVDYVMRHNPFWHAAAAIRRDGVLGRLLHMDLANHAAGLNLPDTHWFWDVAQSGGIWVEHGVHFFDAFAWVAGCDGDITGSHTFRRADGVIDRVECLARFGDRSSGASAHFYHGFTHSSATEQTTVTLTFERGYVTLREWVPTSIEIVTPLDSATLTPYLPGADTTTPQIGSMQRVMNSAPEGKSALYERSVQAGMRDLAHAVRDPAHALTVTGEHALASLRMAVDATQMGNITR